MQWHRFVNRQESVVCLVDGATRLPVLGHLGIPCSGRPDSLLVPDLQSGLEQRHGIPGGVGG